MGLLDRFSNAYKAFIKGSSPEPLSQPLDMDMEKSQPSREMKAYVEDPLGLAQAMGYKDRQFSLSYDILRRMAARDAVINSILTTRINQVSTFSIPARFSRSGVGFEIRLRDPNITPTEDDKKTMVAIEEFLENTGYSKDNSRDDFDTFIRKIARDRLIFDQMCFEIVPDRKGRPAEFYAIDASTIRIASDEMTEEACQLGQIDKKEEIKYVQVIDGKIVAYFTADEMAFCVSNPRTDIKVSGYGYSELEMLVHQITSHLWAEEYNSRFFSQGGTTKGILNLKGTAEAPISPHQLESFKRQWLSQISGMTGAWKTPVVSVDGLEYINVSQSNREMEFEKWMNYLINIACAVYQIDPAEINFPNRGGAGGTGGGGLGDGGIEERLNHSKDKGLRPLLRFIESQINKHIISKFDRKFVFTFVGIDAKSEKEIADIRRLEITTYRTINEIRKEEGLPAIEGGDIILDAQYVSHLGQLKQQEMMSQMGGGMRQQGSGDDGDDDDNQFQYAIDNDKYDDNEDNNDQVMDEDNEEDEYVEKSSTKHLRKSTTKFLTIEIED